MLKIGGRYFPVLLILTLATRWAIQIFAQTTRFWYFLKKLRWTPSCAPGVNKCTPAHDPVHPCPLIHAAIVPHPVHLLHRENERIVVLVHGEHITDLNFHCIVVLVHGEHITDLNFHFKLKLVHGEHITDLNFHCKLKACARASYGNCPCHIG